jgi:GMP synthase-like glutamine amidotransferase
MKILIIQHVSFEGPGSISKWADKKEHETTFVTPDSEDPFPDEANYDMLIVLGGPMNIYEEKKYPWLPEEKDLIRRFIAEEKKVLGICLGAQLLADVLGAEVYPADNKEIGWFPIKKDQSGFADIFPELPDESPAFHWHGDTFDLPEGAQRIYSSDITLNQGFIFGDRVVGLQFHWEVTPESVDNLLKYSSGDLDDSTYVQKPEKMKELAAYKEANRFMEKVLDYFEKI